MAAAKETFGIFALGGVAATAVWLHIFPGGFAQETAKAVWGPDDIKLLDRKGSTRTRNFIGNLLAQ